MRTCRKKLDLEEIEQLAFLGSSLQEIAVHVGRDEAVLKKSRRCIRAIVKGWVRFVLTLRRRMFELAVGAISMCLCSFTTTLLPCMRCVLSMKSLTNSCASAGWQPSAKNGSVYCADGVLPKGREPRILMALSILAV
jgi:hypothetical protein